MEGIQVYSRPFPRGDDNKKRKNIYKILKSSSSEPLDQFQSNLTQMMKLIQFCSNEGSCHTEIAKVYFSSPEPLSQFQSTLAHSVLKVDKHSVLNGLDHDVSAIK